MSNFKFNISNTYTGIVVLILIGLIPLLDLVHPGLPKTHDGQDHVARIANFYQSFSEGNIVPRWAGNLNWGYGHPILMFLYPLPSYFASVFHLLGFSFVDSVKLVFGIGFIASGIAMYLWVRNFMGEIPGIAAGILYMFAPYRFVDLYVRGAIGEHMAFIFPPLILYFLLKLSKRYSYWYIVGGSLSLAGLILSHNAISIMFLPFIGLYTLYLMYITSQKKKFIIHSLVVLFTGFGLSSFFLIPAFIEGKYTLRDIVTGSGEYAGRFINVKDFFYSPWSYGGSGSLSVQLGVLHLLGVIGSVIFINNIKRKGVSLLLFGLLLVYFLFSVFIMTRASDFIWRLVSTLQKFQFPWRFLSVAVFMSSVLASSVFLFIKQKRVAQISLAVLILLVLLFNKDYWHAHSYIQKPEQFYTGIYNSTTDTGESSPIWSVRFMEKRPNARAEIVKGSAIIQETKRPSTTHSYIVNSQGESRVKDNTVYFPGWNVYIDNKKLDVSQIEFQDRAHRGLITFLIPDGKRTVDVKFEETKLRSMANMSSIASLGLLAIFPFILQKKELKKRKK